MDSRDQQRGNSKRTTNGQEVISWHAEEQAICSLHYGQKRKGKFINHILASFHKLKTHISFSFQKKQQNVEAARRYRDKKKAEQCDVETEESVLLSKNKQLKGEVAELEAELKTMKKLMTELGILKSQ